MGGNEHHCDRMPLGNVRVVHQQGYDEIGGESWSWYLVVERVATEKDLEENHYLEDVGDMIWCTVVGVSHCPFCGVALEAREFGREKRAAEYFHLDRTGWMLKRQ